MTPPAELYAASRDILIEQLRTLTAEQATTTVATCPDWSVKDVVGHLSGLVAEKLDGVPPPLGSDESTARQVADRSSMSLEEVCAEWQSNAAAFAAYGEGDSDFVEALIADLVIHYHDIAETLALDIQEDDEAVTFAANRYLASLLGRTSEAGIGVSIQFSDFGAEGDDATLKLTTTPYAFLRSLTGRRSRSEVEAMNWSADPTHLLDQAWNQYGPMQPG